MKVVCIDNVKKGGVILPLTIGKVYETSGGPSLCWHGLPAAAQYTITSDTGELYDLATWRFVSLDEWRERQLKEIGIV